MGCIANFAHMVKAMSRENPDDDYYEKCFGILGGIVPLVCNGSVILAFPDKCNVNGANYTSGLGPGYLCFLMSVILGNLPVALIELSVRAPPPSEIEAKLETSSELPSNAEITSV